MGENCGENAGTRAQGMDDVSYVRPARYSDDFVYFVKKNLKILAYMQFFSYLCAQICINGIYVYVN